MFRDSEDRQGPVGKENAIYGKVRDYSLLANGQGTGSYRFSFSGTYPAKPDND